MIMRVYRCTVVPGKEAQHRALAFTKSHPSLTREDGLIAFYAGKPVPGSEDRTRCMVRIWESFEALRAARGEHWNEPMKSLPEEVRDVYDGASVEHFELADTWRTPRDCPGSEPLGRCTSGPSFLPWLVNPFPDRFLTFCKPMQMC